MFCTACGQQNPEDAMFCGKCGKQIASSSSIEKTGNKSMSKQKAGILGLIIGIPVGAVLTFVSLLGGILPSPNSKTQSETMIAGIIVCAIIGWVVGTYLGDDEQ